jgi:hypothetical protein
VAQATSGSQVGPGNSPSVNPIGSFGPLGQAPGTVTGNSAFGQQHNKTGVCRELLVLLSGEKQARVEPMPRWKNPPSNPIAWDNVQQHIYHDLAKSLGMAFDSNGRLYDTFDRSKQAAVPINSEPRGPEGEYCPSCDARQERGDNGNCNRCGKPWPEKRAMNDWYANGGKEESADDKWERKLRQLWERRDPDGLTDENPYRELFRAQKHAVDFAAQVADTTGSALGGSMLDGLNKSPAMAAQKLRQPTGWTQELFGAPDTAEAAGITQSLRETQLRRYNRRGLGPVPVGPMPGGGTFAPATGLTPAAPVRPLSPQMRAILDKEASLLDSPVAPYIVRPAVGAGLGLGLNEILRLISKARGAQPSDEDVRRDRIMAGSMGAGIGMGQAAAPLIGKVVFGD